ncbi:hypothetical protein EVAR_70435_1 [Eumeta japonica]|uniref:Uncharacterized protein n=1 Tax=Eumeta variegata TaxID=151549 RepID=A0A4C1T659_EUMVA|nr:hypothetical protein EVAR_70435_1 [Eumeta japonica]
MCVEFSFHHCTGLKPKLPHWLGRGRSRRRGNHDHDRQFDPLSEISSQWQPTPALRESDGLRLFIASLK